MLPRFVNPLGRISGDLRELASKVYVASIEQTVSVWIDDEGCVFADAAGSEPSMPAQWIVGTFAAGTNVFDIVDDLRAALRERAKDWIID